MIKFGRGGYKCVVKSFEPIAHSLQLVPASFENFKNNLFFVISALAFFCLSATLSVSFAISFLVSAFCITFFAFKIKSIRTLIFTKNLPIFIYSFLCAAGICFSNQNSFYIRFFASSKIATLCNHLPGIFKEFDGVLILSILGSLVGFYFVFCMCFLFWKKLVSIFKSFQIFDDISKIEVAIYGILFLSIFSLIIFAVLSSSLYSASQYYYDYFYTMDVCPFNDNYYLQVMHAENDIRQPFFSLFSAPLVGVAYLFGYVLSPKCFTVYVLFVQFLVLLVSNFILSKMMKLDCKKRICFMILLSSTYSELLFSLVTEQYVFAYFYLILCLYVIVTNHKKNEFVTVASGGTLLTSFVLLPFMSEYSPIKQFKNWFIDMLSIVFCILATFMCFLRFDVIWNAFSTLNSLRRFTGDSVSWMNKFFQYFEFIKNYFCSPNANVAYQVPHNHDYFSWQLLPISSLNVFGVVIFLLCCLSAILNWKKREVRFSFLWICFSFLILFIIGWGTAENGLILYSLYFGWPFFVLLFSLVDSIFEKINFKNGTLFVSVLVLAFFLYKNIPSIFEMLNFTKQYYPS